LNKEIARPGIARMMPLLSGEAQDSLQRNSSEQVIIKLIVQLCVNNFAGSEGDEYEVLFRQLEHFSMTQAKALMDAIPQPYATALQQSILTIAIRFGAVSIVKALIHSGLDLDATACHFAGAPLTPLQYACRCRHLETIRILLFATKDVNRSFGVSVIGHLIGSDMEGEKVFPQIVGEILHLLLQADVWLQPGDLNDVRFWKDDSLVLAFLRYGKIDKTVRSLFLRGPTCLHVIRHRNEEEAVKCLGVLLEQDCDSPEVTNPEFMGQCQAILSEALFCGYAKVVDYLLSAGVIPTVVSLAGAVRTNSTGLVNRFLAMGIDPNDRIILTRDLPDPELANGCASLREFSCTLPAGTDPIFLNGDLTYIKAYTTPLAEAIRWERQDVVSLFQRIGAFETISKPDTHAFEFRAALDGAIEASNVTLVTALLEALPSQERSQHLGNLSSCFSLATLTDQDQIVSSLLHAGLRPDGRSVCTAVAVRNRRHLRLFLDSGATSTGEALWLAVRWGIADVVKELIIAGSPIDQGHSALQVFRKNGSSMSLPTPWCTPLGEALKEGNHTVVQLLLENGADINFKYQDWSVLAMAVRTGNESMIRGMLACGADPDDPRALLEATGRSFSVIQTLMEAFTEAYPKGGKNFSTLALRQAIRKSDVAQASLFLRYAEINSLEMSYDDFEEAEYVRDKIHTPLGEAIFIRNALIIQILLGTGGDPNSTVTLQKRDPSMPSARRTALLEAISTKDLAIVQLVHGAGAAVNCAANLGIERTPLQLAAEVGSAEIVEYLIKHGANVNGAPCIFGGGTALQLAAIKGYVGIAEVLVKHGGDVNAARGRYQGRTAFEGAAEHGRLDMLLFLYHNGADLVSDGGEQVRRAVELAEKNGQLAAKSLVEQLAQSVARCPSLRLG
jgi:ankyrin repeat protein